jgi:hypothetical protein
MFTSTSLFTYRGGASSFSSVNAGIAVYIQGRVATRAYASRVKVQKYA